MTQLARSKRSSFLSVAIVAVVVPGLFATVALPAYAYNPGDATDAADASAATQQLKTTEAQRVTVGANAATGSVARDAFSATSLEEIQQAAAAVSAASTAVTYLATPSMPGFSLDSVVAIGLQYQGVPYVFGGADPSGFDCSGFVMYVYAQLGVGLSHGVTSQAAAGTAISRDAALPGDLVIMDGHDGIYMGNGMILDAPQPGGVVSVRNIWTDDYYIVRLGI